MFAIFLNANKLPLIVVKFNQTIYRKFITHNPSDYRFVKGSELSAYKDNLVPSQGEKEWFNHEAYIDKYKSRYTTSKRRIATQRITGVDEKLRIVAAIIEPPAYFADSTNSIFITGDSQYSLEYLVALMNSTLFQWRFKLTSTNNNVGVNEIESLPFRMINFNDKQDRKIHEQITKIVQNINKENVNLQSSSELIEEYKSRLDKLVFELYAVDDSDKNLILEAVYKG